MDIRKLIAGLTVVCMLSFSGTALAVSPQDAGEQAEHVVVVSVEDITAVMEQLTEYEEDLDVLARLVYAEARGIQSKAEQAGVIWCALNRVDTGYWGDTISDVVRARSQFAYSSSTPVNEGFRDLAQDIVVRWLLEKRGITDVGRVLPTDYLYFAGRDGHNWFRKTYRSDEYWDWSLPDPYEEPTAALYPAA